MKTIQKILGIIWKHKFKSLAILLLALPFFNGLFLLLYIVVIQGTLNVVFDETPVFFSSNVGREITLTPFAVLAKMMLRTASKPFSAVSQQQQLNLFQIQIVKLKNQ